MPEPTSDNAPLPENLEAAIAELKREKNAVILAHYYQEPEIQDIADYVGDSLGLSQEAAKTEADIIVFAGVYFMGETAKILNPNKQVLIPDLDAGCSLADNCPGDEFREFLKQYPDHTVVTYVNCSAEVKALSDILCTSANAVKVIESLPKDEKIVFAPDKHLGRYLQRLTGRKLVLWDGACIVHETFDQKQIVQLKARHPDAEIIAHPECPEALLLMADHVGSTTGLLKYAKESSGKKFIVVTESGIIHQMQKACPHKTFIPAGTEETCSCNHCPFMRLNTMEKLYLCLRDETPEVTVPEPTRSEALPPITRMLEITAAAA